MKKKIIAIVGMPGAGKSEAASFFKEKEIPVLRFGEETDIGLKKLNKQLTEENERWYREKLRKDYGMAAYALKIKPRIEKVFRNQKIVVLDGLYSWEEYIYLNKYFQKVILLCIYARPAVRYLRLTKRTQRRRNLKEARKRDIAELQKLNKGGPIAIADYLIENDGSISQFKKKLDLFLASIS